MCSLAKEEFLAKAPAFMGDILWAHLEILQKDVDRGANIENVPSNYSDPSFAIPDSFQRTYTQLDVAPSQGQLVAVSSVENQLTSSNRVSYTQRPSTGCYPTSVADYVSNAGSTVDSSSEFSYQMTEMKYSPQQINNGRVPAYPPHLYNDQFENMWSYQTATPALHPQEAAWHQPAASHEFTPAVTPPATTMAPPSQTTSQTPMHHHPAFLQVKHTLVASLVCFITTLTRLGLTRALCYVLLRHVLYFMRS